MNCGERYEFMVDYRSYTHNLSSCKIKAWKKLCPRKRTYIIISRFNENLNCSLFGLYRVPACDASLKCLLLLCFEKIRTKPSGAFMYKLLYVQVLEISHASKRGGTERLVSGSEISWNSISQFLFLISTSANKFVFSP